ncbi:putative 2-aminoethylphosphonate ABC transporter permease subunit [Pokkaliibacter plantistimulans]|uniref:2-aminoethylphosphonate ABC transporter permease subunit n=1 Tax=Proteobacteria bacterium 228 TaxID=2083153 RepID=A0A2S5KT58_9PROT|nr:putative 2-aminoethylphosphonate ABC transporter permease subunit [Pokkaliibacter plantistimulans]PPC78024.1 putative 2-aminoethylphosphonate ABC transporter permease subunit [Pokkaliibacter plantistimulans]
MNDSLTLRQPKPTTARPATAARQRPLRQHLSRDEIILRGAMLIGALALLIALVMPLYTLLSKSVQNKDGAFIGLANFARYADSPSLYNSLSHSLTMALVCTLIVTSLAFMAAYALSRSCMPLKRSFRVILALPILAPSLLPAISLVYLFGNQGVLKSWLLGDSIYGPIGIVIASCFWVLPHAMMIMLTALSHTDARLYESARVLGSSPWRIFFTVTLPSAKYGIISTAFVVFTLVITDFGVPKVIGGQYDMLATDIYKQVIGQQNFEMGAAVSVILLFPAVLAFVVDRWLQRKQAALLTARSVPLQPQPRRWTDRTLLLGMLLLSIAIVGVIGMAIYASLVKYWPYNLSLGFSNYQFDLMDGGGWGAYWNSLRMALYTALFGTGFIFFQAYLQEKLRGFGWLKHLFQMMALLPLAVPGMVLGLAYIFFFNHPANPLNGLYGTLAILVICTIAHFYTVCHLTAVTALKQIDPEFEAVSASLKVPQYLTFWRVTLPVCLPAVLDIAAYLFVNAMTTVSAVVFLYSYKTMLASVSVLNMDDAGDIAPAAAMAVLIMLTCMAARLLHWLLSKGLLQRSQRWRSPA